MKKVFLRKLFVLAILVAVCFSCAQTSAVQDAAKGYLEGITSDTSTYHLVSFEKVLERIDANDSNMFIVDIRKADDYKAGHLPGAVNIGFAKIAEKADHLPKDKQIMVTCYSGQTAGQAIAALRILGFDAYSLKSGMTFGWKPLGLSEDTLEKKENPLPAANNYDWSEDEKEIQAAITAILAEGSHIVAAPEVNKIINSDPLAIGIVDIRNQKAFDESHVERAILIPFAELDSNLKDIPANKPVYIYCFSGQTAGQALMALRLYGLDVFSIKSGMKGWSGSNMPVVGESTGASTGGGCE